MTDKISTYLLSDVGFCDITTSLQEGIIDINRPSILKIYTRENIVLSGIELAKKIAKELECEVLSTTKNSDKLCLGDEIFSIKGTYKNIHKAWKATQILLEYSCKISTYTNNMLNLIKQTNPNCVLATTRKSFPFARELCIQAVIAGGGVIHRLGLYDSVLFFDNHIKAHENFQNFCENLENFKHKMPERKIMVECDNISKFQVLLTYAPDVIQCDKMSADELKECVLLRDKNAPNVIITAAGGINIKNCVEFTKSGVDSIITSAPYTQGTIDLTSKIEF